MLTFVSRLCVVVLAGLVITTAHAKPFLIGTGPSEGGYYKAAQGFSARGNMPKLTSDRGNGIFLTQSSGSVANLNSLKKSKYDLVLAQSDVAHLAFVGKGPFEHVGAFKDLRSVGPVYEEYVHLIVREDSDIKTVKDLKGKRVNLGLPGSGTLTTAVNVLKGFNVRTNKIHTSYFSQGRAFTKLSEGKVDALFLVSQAGNKAIARQFESGDFRLVAIPASEINLSKVPAGNYISVAFKDSDYPAVNAVETVAVLAEAYVQASLPAQEVKMISTKIMKYTRARTEDFAKLNQYYRVDAQGSVPFHDAVARLYQSSHQG